MIVPVDSFVRTGHQSITGQHRFTWTIILGLLEEARVEVESAKQTSKKT